MSAHYVMSYDGKYNTLILWQSGIPQREFVAKWEDVTLAETNKIRDEIIEDAALNDVRVTCEIRVSG